MGSLLSSSPAAAEENMGSMNNAGGRAAFKPEVVITENSTLLERENAATYDLINELSRDALAWSEADANGELAATRVALDNSGFAGYKHTRLELPRDSDGFLLSFDADDAAGIKAFFDRYGVVVVRNVVDESDTTQTIDEVWEFLRRHSPGGDSIDRTRPETWSNANWPALSKMGICGNTVCLAPSAFRNRQAPRVHKAFAAVFGTERLWVNVGRVNVMRPTRSVPFPAEIVRSGKPAAASSAGAASAGPATTAADEQVPEPDADGRIRVDVPEWRTISEWLHFDYVPWLGEGSYFSWRIRDKSLNRGYSDLKLQGILALADTPEDCGGFHCVPGVAPNIRGWAHANSELWNPRYRDTTWQIPKDDAMRADIQKCPLRRGDLLIWSSATPHGNFPNDAAYGAGPSGGFRYVQYIQMTPVDQGYFGPLFNPAHLPRGFEPSPLGRRLLGIDSWDDCSQTPS